MTGLVVVDKPAGPSSMDVVRRVRRAAGGVKTGHAGTLDPLATGVVICCLGRATRCVEPLMGLAKTYEATVALGAYTATDDLESEPQPVAVDAAPGGEAVASACARFVGELWQVPPAHSAARVGGRRAYRVARKGGRVELEPRLVRIDAIEVVAYDWPRLELRVTCGRGTYIRSLARDLGRALGTGGHLARLRRTAVGPYRVEQAMSWQRCGEPIGPEDLLPTPGR